MIDEPVSVVINEVAAERSEVKRLVLVLFVIVPFVAERLVAVRAVADAVESTV